MGHVRPRRTLAAGALFAAIAAAAAFTPAAEPPHGDVRPVVAKVVSVEPQKAGAESLPRALAAADAAYAKCRDYSGYMVREERVGGKLLPAQTAEVRVRCEPFSVYTKTVAPKALLGQELAFVSGRKEDYVRVKPAGLAGSGGFQSVEPRDPKANADSKYPVTQTGIGAVLKRVEAALDAERRAKAKPEVLVAEYKFDGRACTRYEVICEMPHKARFAAKFAVYFDAETKLPVRFEAYDAPKGAETEGELMECVSFVGLKLNAGLGDAVFDK